MMTKKSDSIKTILLGIVSILLVIGIGFASKGLYKELKGDSNVTENKIYGTISEVGSNYVKIKTTDDEDYVLFTSDKLNEGDFVVAYYNKNDKELINDATIELIASNDEVEVITKSEKTTTTVVPTTEVTTTQSATTKVNTTTRANNQTTKTTSTTTVAPVVEDNEDIVSFVERDYQSIDSVGDKETLKDKFIKYVDFIFYGTEINGRTFNSLTTAAKNKVVYYVLLMDSKIDSKFPGYKENIGSKYNSIKAKLIAEYMEAATNLCNQDQDKCAIVKNDLEILKNSCKLTWNVIKDAVIFAKDKGVTALKNWYEVYSGKQ